MPRICIFPRVEGFGGVTSFRLKFESGLRARNMDVTYDLNQPADAVLVLAGTKNLPRLRQARSQGQRIVQRLDGLNWVHRVRWSGLRYTLRAIYGNWNLSFLRKHLADKVIYQSQFVKGWWEDWYGAARVPSAVILNGVDLNLYSPVGAHERPTDCYRLLVVEGSLAGGLDSGLFYAVDLAKQLSKKHKIELVVVGRVDASAKKKLGEQKDFQLRFVDSMPREEIPFLERSSHLLFSAEVNPPCPNSVIEALACGLPVVGFDTGSLSELVQGDAGRLVAHGANPWKLERPDIPSLAEAAEEVLRDNDRFRKSARERAEVVFGLDTMVDEYLKMLLS
ncbi:MAG TPA: glycosyltransferase family 4 protein [Anaerolineales bacterium]|jgi:glycosyltransferase involved in cell wall biosynthesis|nr:glycosyltransferase family 4 protein [Anaerolineales bacterium]HQX15627.1 glycosyltransferase family 4 protein [Anaerolineales bacterium]